MRTSITLIVGLSTVFLFLSIYVTPVVYGQSATLNNGTNNINPELQSEKSDPFTSKGSENNINTDSADNPSSANDGSSSDSEPDGSSSDSEPDDDKKSEDSKSSEEDNDSKSEDDDKKFELPFP